MDNRSLLLDCALKLFASRGYDAVGVQEIVDAAGVTKPTLYHYFGSKQGLLRALLTPYYEEFNQILRGAADYHGNLPATLRRVASIYFEHASQHPVHYRMQLAMWFAPAESEAYQVVSSLNQTQYEIVEQLFLIAAHDHGNMRGRHRRYAVSFIGTINTFIGLTLNGYARLDGELLETAVHQFEHGIYS